MEEDNAAEFECTAHNTVAFFLVSLERNLLSCDLTKISENMLTVLYGNVVC